MIYISCTAAVHELCRSRGSAQDVMKAQLRTKQSGDILLINCCHIACALCCLISVFAIVLCVSFANGLSKGCLRILTALNLVFPVCSLCTPPLLLADHFPIGSPDKILGICRQKERRIKGWLLNTPWQRSGLLFFYSEPPPHSGAPFYIYLFCQRHH